MPEKDPEYDWSFPDAGELPVPVLSIENVSFAYPGGKELYNSVDFGVDLQTRVALVGPVRKLSRVGGTRRRRCVPVVRVHCPLTNSLFFFTERSWKNNVDQAYDGRTESDQRSNQKEYASQNFPLYTAF